jgi:DNA repair protein NreA
MKLPCRACGRVEPQWCNKPNCPLFPKVHIPAKESFSGSTPNLFVGRANYPNVNVGMLATEQYTKHDEPKLWTAEKTPISDILQFRTSLVNSRVRSNVHSETVFADMRALISQSVKPVAVDVDLMKKPIFTVQYPSGTAPHGPSVELKHAAITENVHVPTDVDKVLADQLLTTEQVDLLARKHDNYYIQKLFAAGLLGKEKKLVPTRWSITAVDDTLGKQHLEKIRTFPVLSEPLAYTGGHYGNYYCILFLPAPVSYELFELYVGNQPTATRMWTDYEAHSGRTTYADSTVGGYYAARLGITEHLLREKRQASVLAFRFVTDEYTNPLGVWVVREAVNLCLQTKPLRFATNELALQYLKVYGKRKFNYSVEQHLQESKLLRSFQQRTLSDFR